MNVSIHAKTFLLGEYAALQGYPAMLLSTSPCFEVSVTPNPRLHGIHPDSPAGRLWQAHADGKQGLAFHDPYHGLGGLGASSAQFLGAYYAIYGEKIDWLHLFDAYESVAWDGRGCKPSGYDILSQGLGKHATFCRSPLSIQPWEFSFHNARLLLVHTGVKCQTHLHLQALNISRDLSNLAELVQRATQALMTSNLEPFVACMQEYEHFLRAMGWCAPYTQQLVDEVNSWPGVLASKGCGAMGTDVLAILVKSDELANCTERMNAMEKRILATI